MGAMQERLRRYDEFARYATEMIVLMEEDRRRMNETIRRLDENDERREEIMKGLLQTVTLMQADIVRLDETRQ